MKASVRKIKETKSFKKILVTISLLLVSSVGMAGGDSGGGGKAVVCRNPDKSIRSAELLDLWEARVLYNRPAIISNAPVEEQVAAGIERLRYVHLYPYQGVGALTGSDALVSKLTFIAETFYERNSERGSVKRLTGVNLALTSDSLEDVSPAEEGCNLEQVVTYKDIGGGPNLSSLALMNQDIYEKLNNTNKAALILHEALYEGLRELGETNSLRVRRAVGMVMSGKVFKSVQSATLLPRITCKSDSGKTLFHYVRNGQGYTNIVVERVGKLVAMDAAGNLEESGTINPTFEEIHSHLMSDMSDTSRPGWPFGTTSEIGTTSETDYENIYHIVMKGRGQVTMKVEKSSSPGYVMSEPVTAQCSLVTE